MFRYFTNDCRGPIPQVRKSSLYSRKQATIISDIDPIENRSTSHRCSNFASFYRCRFGKASQGFSSIEFCELSGRRNQARVRVHAVRRKLLAATLIPRNTGNFSGSSVINGYPAMIDRRLREDLIGLNLPRTRNRTLKL